MTEDEHRRRVAEVLDAVELDWSRILARHPNASPIHLRGLRTARAVLDDARLRFGLSAPTREPPNG